MLFGLFLTLGVAVLSVALRSYQTAFAQKAGAIGIDMIWPSEATASTGVCSCT